MMNTAVVLEAVGYLGSALVLVSFLMASVVKLRIVNSVGSLIFAVYALLIRSYPTALMNVCLVGINLYYLWKLRNKEPNYRMLKREPDDGLVSFFLENNRQDITQCFPGRTWNTEQLNCAYVVCHRTEPAGLLMGSESGGFLDIALDYTSPAYRDSSVEAYLLGHLSGAGVHKLCYRNAEPKHLPFLRKMGYQETEDGFEKTL